MVECSIGIEAPLELPIGRGLCVRASSMPRLAVELQVHTSFMTWPLCWTLRTSVAAWALFPKGTVTYVHGMWRGVTSVEFWLVFCTFGSLIKTHRIAKMRCDL